MLSRLRFFAEMGAIHIFGSKPGIKVLFVNHEETFTGAPAILHQIAEHFQKKFGPGAIRVLSKKSGDAHKKFATAFRMLYPADLYPHREYPKLNSFDRARLILSSYQPELVYANTVDSADYAFAAKSLGIPVVLHVHELSGGFENMLPAKILTEDQERWLHKSANHFLCPSAETYHALVRRYPMDRSKLELIHEFIDAEKIRALACERAPEILPRPQVMACGYGSKRKGTDLFVEIARKVPRAQFTWVGKIPFQIDSVPLNLRFVGQHENPFPYLKQADIFLMVSREDPFPLVVLEAMALGKPVITCRSSGGSHYAVADTGVVLDELNVDEIAGHVERLLGDERLRKSLGAKAVERVSREFSPAKALSRIETVVSDVMEKWETGKAPLRKKLAFIHIPKTAGTYVKNYLENILEPKGFMIHRLIQKDLARRLDPHRGDDWYESELLEIAARPEPHQFVLNHSNAWSEKAFREFKAKGWLTFSFIRHPGDQLCSAYFFSREKFNAYSDLSLDQFIVRSLTDSDADGCWQLPAYWREIDHIAEFTENNFRKFLKDHFNHYYVRLSRANTSANLGYDYYCRNGMISPETQMLLEESVHFQNFLEIRNGLHSRPSSVSANGRSALEPGIVA